MSHQERREVKETSDPRVETDQTCPACGKPMFSDENWCGYCGWGESLGTIRERLASALGRITVRKPVQTLQRLTMHTRKIENTDFHYNSDGSGMVEIVHYPVGTTEAKRVEVPFDHLLDFVGTFLQDAEVDHIQGMEPKDYLMRRY